MYEGLLPYHLHFVDGGYEGKVATIKLTFSPQEQADGHPNIHSSIPILFKNPFELDKHGHHFPMLHLLATHSHQVH